MKHGIQRYWVAEWKLTANEIVHLVLSPVRFIFIIIFSSNLTLRSGEVCFPLSRARDQHTTFCPDMGVPLCVQGQTAGSPHSQTSDQGDNGAPASSLLQFPAESVNPERPIWLDSGLGYIYRSWVETSMLDFTNICLFILRHSTWERNIYPVLENCLLSYLVLPHRQVIFIVISLCLRKWGCFILCHRYWASYPSPTQSRILRLYQVSLLSLVTECWQLPVRIQSQKPSGFGGALEVFYHL